MKNIMLATSIFVMQAGVAVAQMITDPNPTTPGGSGSSTKVPEISALEGTAAIAALAAIVLLAWERRRRAV